MALPKRKEFKWALDSDAIKHHIKFNRDMIWESKNGKKTVLMEMDVNHLKNCVAKITREKNWKKEYLDKLKTELIYRQLIYNKE